MVEMFLRLANRYSGIPHITAFVPYCNCFKNRAAFNTVASVDLSGCMLCVHRILHISVSENPGKTILNTLQLMQVKVFIYLFGVLRRFQHTV